MGAQMAPKIAEVAPKIVKMQMRDAFGKVPGTDLLPRPLPKRSWAPFWGILDGFLNNLGLILASNLDINLQSRAPPRTAKNQHGTSTEPGTQTNSSRHKPKNHHSQNTINRKQTQSPKRHNPKMGGGGVTPHGVFNKENDKVGISKLIN